VSVTKSQRDRGHAPGQDDAGKPDLGAHLLQGNIAWNLEQEIADEEDAGAKAIGGIAETQLLPHLQGGKSDIGRSRLAKKKIRMRIGTIRHAILV
jgi:hypothetical protein